METPPEALGEQAFIITDLETGKKYRLTETGDQIEISEGERVPVDEFLDLFGYLSLPKPGTPVRYLLTELASKSFQEPEEKPRTPRERSQTPESPPRFPIFPKRYSELKLAALEYEILFNVPEDAFQKAHRPLRFDKTNDPLPI